MLMTARTHDLIAASLLGVIAINQPVRPLALATVLVALFANQVGGIAPDIDQPTAPFWRNLPVGGYFGKLIDKMLGGHRFITHSLIGVFVLGLLAEGILKFLHPSMPNIDIHLVWWAFMVGLVSHLAADTFTKEGVPWLLPIPYKFGIPPFKSMRITTGKKAEALIFIGILAFDLLFVRAHIDKVHQIIHAIS